MRTRRIFQTFRWCEHLFVSLVVFAFLLFGTASQRHRFLLLFPSPVTRHVVAWYDTPSIPARRMADFPLDPYSFAYGECTWYAQLRNWDEPLLGLGDAQDWATHAILVGLPIGNVPRVGSTVVFPANYDANSVGDTGHVAHVEAVYTGDVFLVSEMNAGADPGGGWGIVTWRYIFPPYTLSFIY